MIFYTDLLSRTREGTMSKQATWISFISGRGGPSAGFLNSSFHPVYLFSTQLEILVLFDA